MRVGDLVKCTSVVHRPGQTGVIVKRHPPRGRLLVETFSVLFWDETIEEVAGVILEVLI